MPGPLSDLLNFQWPGSSSEPDPGSPAHAWQAVSDAWPRPDQPAEIVDDKRIRVTRLSDGKSKVLTSDRLGKYKDDPAYRIESVKLTALRPGMPGMPGMARPGLGPKGSIKGFLPEDAKKKIAEGWVPATWDEYNTHRKYGESDKRAAGVSKADFFGGEAVNAALLGLPEAISQEGMRQGDLMKAEDPRRDAVTSWQAGGRGGGMVTQQRQEMERSHKEQIEAPREINREEYEQSLAQYLDAEKLRGDHPVLGFFANALGSSIPLTPAGTLAGLSFKGGRTLAKMGLDKVGRDVLKRTVAREAVDHLAMTIAGAGAAGATGSLATAPVRLASREHLGLDAFMDEIKNAGYSALFSAAIGGGLHTAFKARGTIRDLKNESLKSAEIERLLKTGQIDRKALLADPEVARAHQRLTEARANAKHLQSALERHRATQPKAVPEPAELPPADPREAQAWRQKVHSPEELEQKIELDARHEMAVTNLMARPEREIFKSPVRWLGIQKAIAKAQEKYGDLDANAYPPEVEAAVQTQRDLRAKAPPEVMDALATVSRYSKQMEQKASDLGFKGDAESPIAPAELELPPSQPTPPEVVAAQQLIERWPQQKEWFSARKVVRDWRRALESKDRSLDDMQDFGNADLQRGKLAEPGVRGELLEFERSKLEGTNSGRKPSPMLAPPPGGTVGEGPPMVGGKPIGPGDSPLMQPIPRGADYAALKGEAAGRYEEILDKHYKKDGTSKAYEARRFLPKADKIDEKAALYRMQEVSKARNVGPWGGGKSMFMEPIPPGADLSMLEAQARAKIDHIQRKMIGKSGKPRKNAWRNLEHPDKWDYEGAQQRLKQIEEVRAAQEKELRTTPIRTMIDFALEDVGAGKAKTIPEIVEFARKARVHLLGDGTQQPAGKIAAQHLESMIKEVEDIDTAIRQVPRSLLRQEMIDRANKAAKERDWQTQRLMSEHGMLQEQENFLHDQQAQAMEQEFQGEQRTLDYARRDVAAAEETAGRGILAKALEGRDLLTERAGRPALPPDTDPRFSPAEVAARQRVAAQAPQQQGQGRLSAGWNAAKEGVGSIPQLVNTLTTIGISTAVATSGVGVLGSAGLIAGGSLASMIARKFFYDKTSSVYKAVRSAGEGGGTAKYRETIIKETKAALKAKIARLPKLDLVESVSRAQFDTDHEGTFKATKGDSPGLRLASVIREKAEQIAHAAADPDGLTERLRGGLAPARMVDPDLVDQAKELWLKTINFLNSKMPRNTEPVTPFQKKSAWLPSDEEASTAARYIAAAIDPSGQLLDELHSGRVNEETIETVQTLRPELFNWMRDRVLDTLMEGGGDHLSPEKRSALGAMFGVSMDPNEDPKYVNEMNLFVASTIAGEAQQPQAGGQGGGGYAMPKRQVSLGSYTNATIAGKFGG